MGTETIDIPLKNRHDQLGTRLKMGIVGGG